MMKLTCVAISALLLTLASCADDDGAAPPSTPQPPADVPTSLNGNWSLTGATCDLTPIGVPAGGILLAVTTNRVVATTILGIACELESSADLAVTSATSLSVTNATLACNPAGCDADCGMTENRTQVITYARTGDTLEIIVNSDDFLPELCNSGATARLTFTRN